MPESRPERLVELSERLDDAARRLGDATDADEATRVAAECAELAAEAAGELDRLARATPQDSVPGQEELL